MTIHESDHWKFAYSSAIYRLEMLLWEFDFEKEARGHNYTGIPNPHELISIIDGFLSEKDNLSQGDVTRLIKFRERLSTKLTIAFDTGKQVAHQLWDEASEDTIAEYMDYGADIFHKKAKSLADLNWSLAEQSWFVEAFCKQWQQEWTENVRRGMDNE